MRAMKHKPSFLEECGSARLPVLKHASALPFLIEKHRSFRGRSVKPPPEGTRGGVFLITLRQYQESLSWGI